MKNIFFLLERLIVSGSMIAVIILTIFMLFCSILGMINGDSIVKMLCFIMFVFCVYLFSTAYENKRLFIDTLLSRGGFYSHALHKYIKND